KTKGGDVIEGNYIGTNATGTAVLRNLGFGVFINGSPGNTIGGTAAGMRNVISGNARGIEIVNGSATGNVVQGNLIGTDVTGTLSEGNGDGVVIQDSPGNTVGGTTVAARNIISGNGDGIDING